MTEARDLGRDLRACVQAVRAMLMQNHAEDWVRFLDHNAHQQEDDLPVVVVAGESKRGKSAFINALLGQAGLSPSGFDQTTSVYITFAYGNPGTALVRRLGGLPPVPAQLSELRQWGTEQSNPGNQRRVAAIEAIAPAPLLREVTIIDTPGTGSLHAGHGEPTLQALGLADALLFVTDASSPITDAELAFLARAASRVEYVAVILTKVEDYPGWRTIRRDDADLLARRGRELSRAPVLPVQSQLALDEPNTPAIRTETGLTAVEEFLRGQITANAAILAQANLARACLTILASTDRMLAAEQAADTSPQARAALDAEQQRLAELASVTARWRQRLDSGLKQLHQDTSKFIQQRIRDIEDDGLQQLAQGAARNSGGFRDTILSQLAALNIEAQSAAADGAADLAADLLDALDDNALAGITGISHTESEEWRIRLPGERKRTAYENLMTLSSGSSAHSIAMVAAPAVGMILGPIGWIMGLALSATGAMIAYKGKQQAGRDSDIRAWLTRQLLAARQMLADNQRIQMQSLSKVLTELVTAQVGQRQAELEQAVSQQQQTLAQDQQHAQQRRAQRHQMRAWLAEMQDRLEGIMASLRQQAQAVQDTRITVQTTQG